MISYTFELLLRMLTLFKATRNLKPWWKGIIKLNNSHKTKIDIFLNSIQTAKTTCLLKILGRTLLFIPCLHGWMYIYIYTLSTRLNVYIFIPCLHCWMYIYLYPVYTAECIYIYTLSTRLNVYIFIPCLHCWMYIYLYPVYTVECIYIYTLSTRLNVYIFIPCLHCWMYIYLYRLHGWMYIYSQTCLKQPPRGSDEIGCLLQVTS